MAHHHQIAEEGLQAYRANRMAEAALLYRRAALVALELSDRGAWFKYMVWAANATWRKGDVRTGLALLLETRLSEPDDAPQYEVWVARKQVFSATRSTRPERIKLEEILADLHLYATTHRVPKGDFPELEGGLLELCGDWSSALARYEAAWQAFDGEGYLKSGKAYNAAICCLRLGQFAACRDWIAAIDQCGEGHFSGPLLNSAQLAIHLALAEGQPFANFLPHLRTYTDRAASQQCDDVNDEVREATARCHLLDPCSGDPAADFHPSRDELRRPSKDRQNVHSRYADHLLHLDYRIACLRHTANVPAVDDLYYNKAQQVPAHLTPVNPDQFRHRLHKARAAVQSIRRYARHLDILLECDYRQREVQAHSERIEEMALAAG